MVSDAFIPKSDCVSTSVPHLITLVNTNQQIEALHEIIALHNQYTVAIMRHITDHSTDINEAITDIFTRKQALNDAVDAYMNEYDIILEVEL